MLHPSTLKFLKGLAKNNNKPWMDDHRNDYLEAKGDFESFITALILTTSKFDNTIQDLTVKDCTFRLNRDIRFSKNKTPYKINLGASLNRDGKKSIYAGYYFHLEPGGNSFAGGGIWMPQSGELKKLRQEIDYNFEEFAHLLTVKNFKSVYGLLESGEDVKLTNLPRGYDKDNPAAEYVKLKSILALKKVPDADLLKPTLLKDTAKTFEALHPLINFLNRALD